MTHRSLSSIACLVVAAFACGCSRDSESNRSTPAAEQQSTKPPAPQAQPATPTADDRGNPPVQPPLDSPSSAVGTSSQPAPRRTKPAKTSADRTAAEKAKADRLVEEQRAVNQAQAETNAALQRQNAELQKQMERLKPREFTLSEGTVVTVRTATELSTERLSNGSTFEAVLEQPLMSDDTVVAKAGTPVTGVVVSSDSGGRVKGTASLSVGLRSIVGVNGRVIPVRTDSYSVQAKTTKGRDAARTGIATGVGAAIGAIAGGGKGAAIGAGTGAAAGVAGNMATRGEAAVIPAETLLELRLTSPVTVILQP